MAGGGRAEREGDMRVDDAVRARPLKRRLLKDLTRRGPCVRMLRPRRHGRIKRGRAACRCRPADCCSARLLSMAGAHSTIPPSPSPAHALNWKPDRALVSWRGASRRQTSVLRARLHRRRCVCIASSSTCYAFKLQVDGRLSPTVQKAHRATIRATVSLHAVQHRSK